MLRSLYHRHIICSFLIPVSLSLRRVGACDSHNKYFPGGVEVTDDLVKWVLNMAEQIYYYCYYPCCSYVHYQIYSIIQLFFLLIFDIRINMLKSQRLMYYKMKKMQIHLKAMQIFQRLVQLFLNKMVMLLH